MPRASILYNPVAGASGAEAVARRAEQILRDVGYDCQLVPTRDREGARAIAREVRGKTDLLVVAGGDGSLREALDGLGAWRDRVRVALLPVGNANVAAHELGLCSTEDMPFEVLRHGEEARVDLAELEFAGRRETFIAVLGAGWDAITVGMIDRLRRTRLGRLWYRVWADSAYFLCGWIALLRMRSPRLRLYVDDEEVPGPFRALHVCNFRHYGKGMRVVPDAHALSGRLHFQARRRTDVFTLAWHLVCALRGWRSPAFISTYGEGEQIRVQSDGPIAIQLDGDAHPDLETFSVRVLPAAARVLVPVGWQGRGDDARGLLAPSRRSRGLRSCPSVAVAPAFDLPPAMRGLTRDPTPVGSRTRTDRMGTRSLPREPPRASGLEP